MPFEDNSFQLVVFDPPHNVRPGGPLGVNGLMYGALHPDTEQDDLRRGFAECWRVLAPGGALIFKWAGDIKRVKPHFPAVPIVGTRVPRGLQTWWLTFYKPLAKPLPKDDMTLPTTKNTPGQNPLNKKMLLYAEPKVGKSTAVSKMFPNAIYFATDPTGLEELSVFKVDVRSWHDFREAGAELAKYLASHDEPLYDAICVDTVDELSRLCSEAVLSQLPGGPDAKTFKHASDWEYGKAWNAISEEFRLRVAKLCALGLPVVFVSHAKSKTLVKKTRTGQKYDVTIMSPDIGSGGLRDWLLKFVDYIFYAEVIHDDGKENRVIRTTPSESYMAGARQAEGANLLPETLPLDGARLRKALEATGVHPDSPPGDPADTGHTASPVETNGKAEPKRVQDARKVIAEINEQRVTETGYTEKERKALEIVAKHEAKA